MLSCSVSWDLSDKESKWEQRGRECVTRGRETSSMQSNVNYKVMRGLQSSEIGTMPGRGRGVRVGGVCGHSILLLNGSALLWAWWLGPGIGPLTSEPSSLWAGPQTTVALLPIACLQTSLNIRRTTNSSAAWLPADGQQHQDAQGRRPMAKMDFPISQARDHLKDHLQPKCHGPVILHSARPLLNVQSVRLQYKNRACDEECCVRRRPWLGAWARVCLSIFRLPPTAGKKVTEPLSDALFFNH